MNNVRCTQARKTTHDLDGKHQYVDRTIRGRVYQNDRGQVNGESTSMVWPTLRSRTAKEQNPVDKEGAAEVQRYVRYMLSAVRLLSVVCLSVTLVHPTQAVELFGNFFSPYDSSGTLLFWCQKSLVGDAPFPLKFLFKVTDPPFK